MSLFAAVLICRLRLITITVSFLSLPKEVWYDTRRIARGSGCRLGVRAAFDRRLDDKDTFRRGAARGCFRVHEGGEGRRRGAYRRDNRSLYRRQRDPARGRHPACPRPRRPRRLCGHVQELLPRSRRRHEIYRRGGHERQDFHRALHRFAAHSGGDEGGAHRHRRALYPRRKGGDGTDHSRQLRALRTHDRHAREGSGDGGRGGVRSRHRPQENGGTDGGHSRAHQHNPRSLGFLLATSRHTGR